MSDYQQAPGPFGMYNAAEAAAIHGGAERALLAAQCRIAELEWRDKSDAEKRAMVERQQMAAREEAKQQLAAEVFAGQDKPTSYSLAEFLARDLPATKWAVRNLVIREGNVIIIAPRKVGKTTWMLHYLRTRLDGGMLLGQYESTPLEGRIGLWDLEMSDQQLQEWLQRKPPDSGACEILPLRGFGMPLTIAEYADFAVDWLKTNNIKEWIIDPFGRLMSGIGDENSSTDVRRLLDALTEIKRRAQVERIIIAVHAGKDAEKGARGSGVIEDWPDTIITLAKDDKTGQRTFRAMGRDVDITEEDMDYNPTDGSLLLTGPAWMKKDRRAELLDIIRRAGTDGLSTADLRELKTTLNVSNEWLEETRADLVAEGLVTIVERGRQRRSVAVVQPSWQRGRQRRSVAVVQPSWQPDFQQPNDD